MNFKQIVEQVDTNARELRPHLVALTIITGVLFAAGWLVGIVFRAVWLLIAWAWAAGVVGFKTANGKDGT